MTGRHSLRVPMLPHETVLNEARDIKAEEPSTPWQGRWPLIIVILLGVLAVLGGIIATRSAGVVETQRDETARQAQDLGREVVAACAQGLVVQDAQGRNLCQRAAQVQTEPVPGIQGLPGEPGRPPTAEEIRAAVDAYMAQNPPPAGEPGRPPTADEVAAAVAQYLIANPPAPGRPPTASEIADAAATYFATNPPPEGPRGPRGETGEPGRPPTAEEIRTAVDAYLEANPPPEGPRGPAGPTCQPGTSLQTVQFADGRFGLACVFDEQPDPDPDPTTEPPAPTTAPTSAAVPTTDMDDGGLLGG